MLDTSLAQLGYDVTYELDEFSKPRLRGNAELIKNTVLAILFSKRGQYPSIPYIGLNIEQMLYSYYDEIDENDLREQIINQCEAMRVYFNNGTINIRKTIFRNKPSLMIHIEVPEDVEYVSHSKQNTDATRYQIGITFNELDQMIYDVAEGVAA